MSQSKAYLGDGAYVDYDQCGVELTTLTHDRIVLEGVVLLAFAEWMGQNLNSEFVNAFCDKMQKAAWPHGKNGE